MFTLTIITKGSSNVNTHSECFTDIVRKYMLNSPQKVGSEYFRLVAVRYPQRFTV